MTSGTQEQPLVFVKNALGNDANADTCGRGHACTFCPKEDDCRLDKPAHNKTLIESRLAGLRKIVLVLANKGGVGKSTVAANLAAALAADGFSVGLADADVHGPNAPRLFGLHESRVKVEGRGIAPPCYELEKSRGQVAIGSLGFFLEDSDTPVVWRDAYKHDYIHHMLGSFDWGPLDFLIVDMPPGTGNELITLTDVLEGTDTAALLVSSADAIALQDTLKASRFCTERGLPVIGLVENYAGTVCPHCGNEIELFPRAPEVSAFETAGIRALTRLPFSAEIAAGAAEGRPAAGQEHSAVKDWMSPVVGACVEMLRESTHTEVRESLESALAATDAPDDPALADSVRRLIDDERTRLANRSNGVDAAS